MHLRTRTSQTIAKSRLAIAAIVAALMFGGFGCKVPDAQVTARTKPVTLKYWRVFDDSDAFADIVNTYRALHPNINIEYRKFRYDEYEKELLNALAEDRGPDVISLHNTWMREWQTRLLPCPPTISMPYREVKGSIKKEVVTTLRESAGVTVQKVANDFIDAVSQDAVLPAEQSDPRAPLIPRVYGLPLSVDTLVMYYNRSILNDNGIASPAAHWLEFQEHVKKITKIDELGTIIQPATSLGTADNVERSPDILATLMLQNGARMTDDKGLATFDKIPAELAGRTSSPSAEALIFYSDFANPEKEVYTWNDKMPESLAAFVSGKTAYFFGYSYHLPIIRMNNPGLNFGIAPFPQIQGNQPVNYANYWIETVSNKTKNANEAWDFIQFMAQAEQAKTYLAKTGKPTALRSLVNMQLENPDLTVFASQLPSSLSWYKGSDALAAEQIFKEMIGQMHSQEEPDPAKIVELGAIKVNQTVD